MRRSVFIISARPVAARYQSDVTTSSQPHVHIKETPAYLTTL